MAGDFLAVQIRHKAIIELESEREGIHGSRILDHKGNPHGGSAVLVVRHKGRSDFFGVANLFDSRRCVSVFTDFINGEGSIVNRHFVDPAVPAEVTIARGANEQPSASVAKSGSGDG
ncbi:MAG: hypothetical protein KDA60_13285, partial [Planctomycetales bacterium]|nr:hypothetical protein [Planctomycetales bacterium]